MIPGKRMSREERKNEITRWLALIIAFAGVYYFFIKLLFL
jgi:hypothetical protein